MGSPITFSGFNNIDFGVVLNAIMQQERAPLAAVESQKTALQAQDSAFATFATKLGALESAVATLGGADSLAMVAATSSDDTAVGVSSGSGSIPGRYEVVVSSLARAQVTMSQTTYAALDTVVATSGVLSLAQFSQPPIDIPITGATTLQDLADAINQAPNSPVSASVVQVSPGQYRLVLTGRSTGIANGFTVTMSSPLTGGQGLGFIDTDGDGTTGDDALDNVQAATDASLTVNQIPITSASNVLSDVIPGATMTLKTADPAQTIAVDVQQDHSDIIAKVEAFATAYNDVLAFIGEQTTAAAAGKANIGRDPMVRQFRESLRFTMMGAETSGTLTRLAEVGIGFDRSGKVVLEEDRLTSALNASVADVQTLFAGAGNAGRFGALKTLISGYTTSGGLVSNVRDRIDEQVARLTTRMSIMEEQLAIRRAALQREFIAADRAMAQLNSQANSLGQLGGQYRLF
ncbi:MAG TPA: flagellar filament capping protein FliD [Vicinamibacterales bacterium]